VKGGFWVDPEQLGNSGRGYWEAGDGFGHLAREVIALPGDNMNAFGDDKEGKEFFETFYEGQKMISDGLVVISGSMTYIGDGVQDNGKSFGEAREYAEDASKQFHCSVGEPPFLKSERPELREALVRSVEPPAGEPRNLASRSGFVEPLPGPE